MTKTFKVSNGCKKCGNDIYYYPAKLVLENSTEMDLTEKD